MKKNASSGNKVFLFDTGDLHHVRCPVEHPFIVSYFVSFFGLGNWS
jgi:hypothetical protein